MAERHQTHLSCRGHVSSETWTSDGAPFPGNLPRRHPPGPAGASSLGPGSAGRLAVGRGGSKGQFLCVSLCLLLPLACCPPSFSPSSSSSLLILGLSIALPCGPRMVVKIMLPRLVWNVLEVRIGQVPMHTQKSVPEGKGHPLEMV